jgi:methyl-accepting chemotaxis protein
MGMVNDIQGQLETLENLSHQIAAAAEQQESASEQINQSVHGLASSNEHVRASGNQIEEASTDMELAVAEMVETIKQYKYREKVPETEK